MRTEIRKDLREKKINIRTELTGEITITEQMIEATKRTHLTLTKIINPKNPKGRINKGSLKKTTIPKNRMATTQKNRMPTTRKSRDLTKKNPKKSISIMT